MSKRVADVLVETLEAAGVKRCYGIVGDTLNRIAHAIDRSEIDGSICGMRRPARSRPGPKRSSPAVSRPAPAPAVPAASTSSTGSTRPTATARRSS